MTESLVKTHSSEAFLTAEVHGFLAADSELFKINLTSVKQLKLDLKYTTDISSMAVKSWIQWLRDMPPGCELVLVDCPYSIMNQVSVVAGLVPDNIRCESMILPYYCDTCHKESLVQYEKGKHFKRDSNGGLKIEHPEVSCERPNCKITLDVLEDKFVEFISKLRV